MKLSLILFFSLIVLSCSPNSPRESEKTAIIKKTEQYKTVQGVDSDLLSLDVYYQDQFANRPVVVYVHGGGWSIGDKSNAISSKKTFFSDLGYVFASVNYRLSPVPFEVNNPDRIKYPTHNEDLASAIAWIYNNIEDFGGDPSRIALIGHSAGAHLVSLTGTNFNILNEVGVPLSVIRGILSVDTAAYSVTDLVDTNLSGRVYLNAFGDNPQQNQEASPVFNVRPDNDYPPFFIVKRGRASRVNMAERFISKLKNTGTKVQTVDASNYSHLEVNQVIGTEEDQTVTPKITSFLEDVFGEG